MDADRYGVHDSHCCIDHGCKYSDDDCPVALGLRKQDGPCEHCGLETEGYYGTPEKTRNEQQEYLDALWENKKQPKLLDPQEKVVARLAKQYGRRRLQSALEAVNDSGMDMATVIDILSHLKHIA